MDEFKIPVVPVKSPLVAKESDKGVGYITCQQLSANENVETKEAFDKNTLNCPYEVPQWSGTPLSESHYKFEVLKSGQIIEEINNLEKKPYWVFGRLPGNDIEMAHPTISRFHAVLQYRPIIEDVDTDNETTEESGQQIKRIEKGWYIFDLGSTHGTYLNKLRIPSKVYIRVKVGHILRFGTSSRRLILQGPASDEEPESEFSVTELRDARTRTEEQKIEQEKMQEEAREKEGISWGMGEDAEEESDLSVNPYAATNNEELFLDDPKKTLRGFFEREGLTLEYKCDEMSIGSFLCSVQLPIDDANGRPIIAEVSYKGRKKDCVVHCALEACRILDRHGLLRQANHEPLKRKLKTSDSDDDDDFLDRTGDIERKKIRKSAIGSNITLTYTDLIAQENELMEKIKKVDNDVIKYQEAAKRLKESSTQSQDDLDSFMKSLGDQTYQLDKIEIKKLRVEQQRLQIEYEKLQRLIKIAKPYDLPIIRQPSIGKEKEDKDSTAMISKKKSFPLVGKRNQFKLFTIAKPVSTKTKAETNKVDWKTDEEEIEDDETDMQKQQNEQIKLEEDKQNASIKILKEDVTSLTLGKSEMEEPGHETKSEELEEILDNSVNFSDNNVTTEESITARKRRSRLRMRNKRQEVDIDDLVEHETSEKYAKWIPPTDQTGDGFTPLNEKFGY